LGWGCSIYDATAYHPDASTTQSGDGGASGAGEGGTDSTSGSGGTDVTSGGTSGAGGATDGAGGASGGGSTGTTSDTVTSSSSSGSAGTVDGGNGDADGAGGASTTGTGTMDGAAMDGAGTTGTGGMDGGGKVDAGKPCLHPTLCALRSRLVHRYMFDGSGTVAVDSMGTASGTIVSTPLSSTGSVTLSGGTSDQYVDLPNGIITELTDATFEVWATWFGGAAWQRLFDFGNNNMAEGVRGDALTTFYLTPIAGQVASYNGPAVMLVGFKRADQTAAQETNLVSNAPMAANVQVHIAVVVDDTNHQMLLYRNGSFEKSVTFTDSLSSLTDVNNWLGRSQYIYDSGFGGSIQEFRIYNAALSAVSIQASFQDGPNSPLN
jgi:hypothetical protein